MNAVQAEQHYHDPNNIPFTYQLIPVSSPKSVQESLTTEAFVIRGMQKSGGSSGASDGLFPDKLHDVLDYAERRGLNSIIEWTEQGQAFMVHDPNKLLQLLPKFFGQTQYRSFQRQLGMWYFDRIQQPGDGGRSTLYRHPYFIRGQKAICKNLTREMFKRDPIVKRYVKSKSPITASSGNTTTRSSSTGNNDTTNNNGKKTKDTKNMRKTQSESSIPTKRSDMVSSSSTTTFSRSNTVGNPSTISAMGQNMAIFPSRRPSDPVEYHNQMMELNSGGGIGGGFPGGGILFDTEDVTATRIPSSSSRRLYPGGVEGFTGGYGVGGGGGATDEVKVDHNNGLQDGDLVEFEGRQFYFLERDSP